MTVENRPPTEPQLQNDSDAESSDNSGVTAAVVDHTTAETSAPHSWTQRRALIRIDQRTVDDPEDIPAEDGRQWWYDEGHNHRTTSEGIARDFPSKQWSITVSSLVELWSVVGELEQDGYDVRVSLVASQYRDINGVRVPTLHLS